MKTKNAYCTPLVKVVTFRVEEGFQSPTKSVFNLTNNSNNNTVDGAEWTEESGDLFPRSF